MYWSRERPCLLSVSFFIVCSRAAAFKAIVTGTALLRGSFSAGVRARLLPCLFLPSRATRCVLSRITIYSARFRGIIKVYIIQTRECTYTHAHNMRALLTQDLWFRGRRQMTAIIWGNGKVRGSCQGYRDFLSWRNEYEILHNKNVLSNTFYMFQYACSRFCVNLT